MKRQPQHKQIGLSVAATLMLSLSAVPMSTQAATVTWIDGSSQWNSGRNWDSGAQPVPGDDVYLTQSDNIDRIVTYYNTLYPDLSDSLNSLTIDATGTGTITLSQISYAHPLYATQEIIGYDGSGAYVQSLGSNTVTSGLVLGYNATGGGSYDLSSTGILSANSEAIGFSGTGTFTQSGGEHTVTNGLDLGRDSTGNGSYDLSGTGTLATGSETIGRAGTGIFTQSGGSHTVTNDIVLGYSVIGSGSYDLSGTGALSAGSVTIGYEGTGAFTQSGGTNTVTNDLVLGYNPTGSGSYDLSGGDLSANNETIGYGGTGAFTQSGGTNTMTNDLHLGSYSFSTGSGNGSYDLSGGELSANNEYIGYGFDFINSTFTQSGGANTVTNSLYIGYYSPGSYDLSGTGTLSVDSEIIGYSDTGTFTQSGGTNAVGVLNLGEANNGNGNYDLSGGTLSVSSEENIGYDGYGTGVFTQSGGIHMADSLYLGRYSSNSSGSYDLSAGDLSVNNETIGYEGTGVFTQSGGTHTVANETIGYEGAGTFTQSGGTHTVTRDLVLGYNSTGSGSYDLSGGDLSAYSEIIGASGTGTFTQTGGTNTVTTYLRLGISTTDIGIEGNGTYTLLGGTLNVGTNIVRGTGRSRLNIDGGVLNIYGGDIDVGTLVLGSTAGTSGSYNLSGTDTVTADGETIGFEGMGTFTQSGGKNMTGALLVGFIGNSSGSYDLSGGDLSADNETIGFGGTGSFTQTGGTNTVKTLLTLGRSTSYFDMASIGSYNLSGGDLSAGSVDIGVFGGMGSFIQTGGQNTISNTLAIAVTTRDNGTYDLQGGTLNVTNTDGTGEIINNDTFNYSGGILNADTVTNNAAFNLSGAGSRTVNSDVTNTATGTVKVTDTTVVWTGTFTNDGAYVSDSSDNHFTDLIIGETGYLVSGAGDNWFVSGDLVNNSLQNALWNTDDASLFLNGAGLQNLNLAGTDLGAGNDGYNDNFAWGELSLGSGISLSIRDSNDDGDAAFYAGLLSLADGVDLDTLYIDYILSDYNIYYNPLLAGNAYLNGQTFTLNGSGYLIPSFVPVPHSVWLFGSGLLGLVGIARRRRV